MKISRSRVGKVHKAVLNDDYLSLPEDEDRQTALAFHQLPPRMCRMRPFPTESLRIRSTVNEKSQSANWEWIPAQD